MLFFQQTMMRYDLPIRKPMIEKMIFDTATTYNETMRIEHAKVADEVEEIDGFEEVEK